MQLSDGLKLPFTTELISSLIYYIFPTICVLIVWFCHDGVYLHVLVVWKIICWTIRWAEWLKFSASKPAGDVRSVDVISAACNICQTVDRCLCHSLYRSERKCLVSGRLKRFIFLQLNVCWGPDWSKFLIRDTSRCRQSWRRCDWVYQWFVVVLTPASHADVWP